MARELELWDCTWTPRRTRRGVEMSIPPSNEWKGTTCDWRGYEIVPELSYLWVERIWNPLREEEGWEEIAEGRVESIGTIVLSERGWHLFCTALAAGQNPMWLLGDAEARTRQAGESFANKGWDTVSCRVVMGGWKEFKPPGARIKTWVPEFVADWFGGFDHVTEVADTMERIHVNSTWLAGEFYKTSLTREVIICREVAATPYYVDDVFKLFEGASKSEMAMRRARMPQRPMHPRPPTKNGDVMVECLWDGMRINTGPGDDLYTDLRVTGTVYLPELGWHMLGMELALGHGLLPIFQRATRVLNRVGQEVGGRRNVGLRTRVEIGGWREFKAPMTGLRCRVPRFMVDLVFGSLRRARDLVDSTLVWIHLFRPQTTGMFYDVSVRHGPFWGNQAWELIELLEILIFGLPHLSFEEYEPIIIREIEMGENYLVGLADLFEEPDEQGRPEGPADKEADREARLIEQMMAGDEEDLQDAGSREGRRAGQDEARYVVKDDSHKGTPSKKGKDKSDPPTEGTENAMTPPAIDSGTSRLPASPKVTGACDGLLSLRERVLGWFDPEGTPETREKQKESKEGEGADAAREAGGSEDGLKKVVATLSRTLNKNQGYLADAKKKLTFDGANITEFLIDYENLAALLKWTEEEKMEHLGQHISLSLGRDIMTIIASSGSWKETRNEMMRKYLKAKKMAIEAELAAVQRKNYATYNNFLRAFTLVALRIPGVTDRIMKVTILGFRCGAYGRRPHPVKTDKISQWPTPLRTTTEVRAFLGVVGFWRIFIKGFAKIAEPIRAMIREGGTMDWTEYKEEAAQTLKDILSSDQVTLAAPCFNDEVGRPFILKTDGGPLAVGEVLIQRSEEGKERPIRFESRTLNLAERRYSQFKKEVLAILHCLKTFQAYLFGRRFILRIDPTNVVGAPKNYKPIDPTVGRWISFIWQFDYKVERSAGLRNRADGLSRVCITPEGVEDAEPIDAFLEYEGGTLVVDNEMADPAITTGQLLIQTLEKGAPAVVAKLREGPVTTVRRKEEKDSWGAEVGAREELMAMTVEGGRDAVMTLAEAWAQKECQYLVNLTREEQGTDRKEHEFFLIQMYEGVLKEIGLLLVGNKQPTEVSPKAREEVEKYVLRNDHLFKKEEGMIPRRVVCGRSRQLDVIHAMHDGLAGGHRSSKGTLAKIVPLYFWPWMAGMVATYILDARDNLNGYVEAIALKKKTGKAMADWVEDFYLRHPFVRRFIADNGTKFVNQEVLNRLKTLCVAIKITEPYHPEANAPVERGHWTLKNTIAKLAADNLGSWSRFLKQAVFAENMTPKRTTGCIPAELWYGREIDFPIEALVPTWNRLDNNPHLSTEEFITARCQQVARNEEALEEVVNRVTDNRMRDKARWNQVKNIRKEPLQLGENAGRGTVLKTSRRVELQEKEVVCGVRSQPSCEQGGRKQGTRGPSPLKEGEPIELSSDNDLSSKEEGNPEKRRRLEEGNLEEGQRPGENESVEFIDLTSDEEDDEVTTPTREERGRGEQPSEKKDKWIKEFGYEFNNWFDQCGTILRYQWIMKAREKLGRGEDLSPTTFFTEQTLLQFQATKRQMEQEGENRARREAQRRPPGQ
ncbi:hypothetical protein CBR_g40574 [Chara braunii]|uniref:Integrase catalytic domain-containing protein n=1 Tax=Chara braunii TaxID=69332 RepID=A0A388K272_CHABU|nr:hypothetical protein CBR_g40574 [Chara braunii]|eukprot:GBG64127.1 hypothetical protein CBR_g40574 [Chara braunii]